MTVKLDDYFDRETYSRIKAVADQHETPFLVVDLKTIDRAYDELVEGFPFASVYYAVKANPANEVLSLLKDKGSNFDIASIYELEKVLALGVKPEQISFGNTIKKSRHIRAFYEKGVRLYATDSEADLRNIAKAAPAQKSMYVFSPKDQPLRIGPCRASLAVRPIWPWTCWYWPANWVWNPMASLSMLARSSVTLAPGMQPLPRSR